ncbi:unnamed protein product [Psylliodes chrysocephalus]|uniref:EF-hand domain-containing protein n=1 Tax=Psylliodes chrysocephalus TaxID=3402493 RepID=A0A9P0CST4_9CUCU|nr:unnamed protein product [Psylliodes chrysocephala]
MSYKGYKTNRSESPTSRQESEMVTKNLKELHAAGNVGDPIERIRLLCLSKGASGILHLGRTLRLMDNHGSRNLSRTEFLSGLKQVGLDLSEDETKEVFHKFDTNGDASVNIDEFLINIRPPLNDCRTGIIDKAFCKMDKTGDGLVTMDQLKRVYNVKASSRYQAGSDSEESILKTFLDHFEKDKEQDGKVTKEEFINYYSAISASIDNDCYFDLMMRQLYKL